jgi:anti-sigma B factor antagonist
MPIEPPHGQLTLDVQQAGDKATIRCRGRLVYGVGHILYSQVCQLLPQTKHLVLDLGDLTTMDSMGLGTLVRIYVSTKSAGCTLELIHLGTRIRELLGVAGLLSVFRVIGENGVPMKF